MNILSWIVVGLIAGWLAGIVMRGSGYGILPDLIIGIVGAMIGGFLAANVFGFPGVINGINFTTIVVAFLGALLTIGIISALTPRTSV